MKGKSNSGPAQPSVLVDSEVIRHIRQHARSCNKAEVCGVLIGNENGKSVEIQACIEGANAAQGGTHVTFTQDTWEHIYQVKDRHYPNQRIVGWYHSHPGFGVFLSDHDTFIQKNFFSSPRQVAWVFDPHSDEEGCFGWRDGRIERLSEIVIADRRGGERAEDSGRPEPVIQVKADDSIETGEEGTRGQATEIPVWAVNILSHLSVLALGFVVAYVLFPRVMVMPVPVDPKTGQPMIELMDPNLGPSTTRDSSSSPQSEGPGQSPRNPAKPEVGGAEGKGDHARP